MDWESPFLGTRETGEEVHARHVARLLQSRLLAKEHSDYGGWQRRPRKHHPSRRERFDDLRERKTVSPDEQPVASTPLILKTRNRWNKSTSRWGSGLLARAEKRLRAVYILKTRCWEDSMNFAVLPEHRKKQGLVYAVYWSLPISSAIPLLGVRLVPASRAPGRW